MCILISRQQLTGPPLPTSPLPPHGPAGDTPRVVLETIAAQLFVADIGASCAFFTHVLGFTTEFVYGDPPFYAQVRRDDVRLALRHMDDPVFASGVREREDLLSASITVGTRADIERLFAEFQSTRAPFHQTLRTEPWGARTFIVRDPDGNLLLFAGPGDA
jgi:catechol 2,3-dioxygenase-like lactoylglutathione lyase family enzyme